MTFATRRLQKLLSTERELRKQFGDRGAKKVRTRLHQLEAADTLDDLRHMPGRWHELTSERDGQLAADLHAGFRLIVRPAEPEPKKEDGGLDWTRVVSVVVIEIVDYHG